MEGESSTEHITCLVYCEEVKEYKVGLDDDWFLWFLIVGGQERRTELLDGPQSSWLGGILDAEGEPGGAVVTGEDESVHADDDQVPLLPSEHQAAGPVGIAQPGGLQEPAPVWLCHLLMTFECLDLRQIWQGSVSSCTHSSELDDNDYD